MGFTTEVLSGVAQLLAGNGVAEWKPPGTDPYLLDEAGIVLGVPTQQPAALIALAVYRTDDDPSLSDSVVGLQVRVRGRDADPRDADALADGVFDTLHGYRGYAGSVRIVYARRVSTLPLGVDDNGRHERTDNYDLTVHRPSPHRE
jgi:hypothetical protein